MNKRLPHVSPLQQHHENNQPKRLKKKHHKQIIARTHYQQNKFFKQIIKFKLLEQHTACSLS